MSSKPSSDVAFTEAVKDVQTRRNSRDMYARIEAAGGFRTVVDAELMAFLSEVDTAFLTIANAAGQPYAQHRGGPRGFIRAVDRETVGFAGNRQYVTTGNLAENDKVFLFLMDCMHARRVKIWGRARIVENDRKLIDWLMPKDYRARAEQAILVKVEAWDVNCPQHIPKKLDADMAAAFERLQARIDALEAENARLVAQPAAESGAIPS